MQVLGSTDPVEGAEVRFRALNGGDLKANPADLSAAPPAQAADIVLATGPDGVAECFWKLFDGDPTQRVEASLVSVPGDKRLVPRAILFNAQLGKASEIAYYPNAGCTNLASAHTVEDALDRLATLAHLAYVGGAGQVGLLLPGQGGTHITLARPIQVQVVGSCGPLEGAEVTFMATTGSQLAETLPFPTPAPDTLTVKTKADGLATCFWRISASAQAGAQFVTAKLTDVPSGYGPTEPQAVEFNASLVTVGEGRGGGCCVTVAPEQMSQVIRSLVEAGQQNIEICLEVTKDGGVVDRLDLGGGDLPYSLTVRGCGKALPVQWQPWTLSGMNLFHLQDVLLEGVGTTALTLKECREVIIEGCWLANQRGGQDPILAIQGGALVQVRRNVFIARGARVAIAPQDILEGLAAIPFSGMFIGKAAERQLQRSQISQGLAALSAVQRRQFALELKKRLNAAQPQFTEAEAVAYSSLLDAMSPAKVDPAAIDLSLAAIAATAAIVARGTGLAIVLDCAAARTYIVDNIIAGTLSLYGRPAGVFLNIKQYELLGSHLKHNRLQFLPEDGELHLRGNDIARLDGAGDNVRRLDKIATSGGGQIDNIFSAIFLTENRLYADPQNIVPLALAGHVIFNGNSFDVSAGNQIGAVFAVSASYTGNTASSGLPSDTVERITPLIDVSAINGDGINQAANPGVTLYNM
ncbi:MAG: hypothetical protein BWY52_03215 [Chloroflexi bacterium ADurb.Bin325]|nr:MAG: hypothetical protein BWY52_03215 [Chloroflexi bacterium ADurb.Bin325]